MEFVNVFDTSGNLLRGGVERCSEFALGVALAPANWGAFGGALLVGKLRRRQDQRVRSENRNLLGPLAGFEGKSDCEPGFVGAVVRQRKNRGREYLVSHRQHHQHDNLSHGLLAGIAPPSQVTSVVNAASIASAGTVAPGEIVVLNGFTVGPIPLASATIPASGALGTSLATVDRPA